MDHDRAIQLREFANRYTAAWCSQDAASVAAFFSPSGSLSINGGAPAVGRSAVTAAAHGFMTTFPDLEVTMDDLLDQGERVIYKWTLSGTTAVAGVPRLGFFFWFFWGRGGFVVVVLAASLFLFSTGRATAPTSNGGGGPGLPLRYEGVGGG